MKSIFITGATSGLGSALAKLYFHDGWQVGLCGRSEEKFKKSFPNLNSRFHFYQVDVTDRDKLKVTIDDFANIAGGIDIIIANAGIGFANKTRWPNFDLSHQMMHINVFGTMNTFEAALTHMKEKRRGHLVAVASVSGLVGLPGVAAYSASKAAIIKMCESYSLDLRRDGIHVTCINPGFIDTPLTRKNHHPMPFIMSSETAAHKIQKAIKKKKIVYTFPLPMAFAMKLLEVMPRSWYRFFLSLKLFNFSRG